MKLLKFLLFVLLFSLLINPGFSDDLTDCLSIFFTSRNKTTTIYTIQRPIPIRGRLPYFARIDCPSKSRTIYAAVDFNTARGCYVVVPNELFSRDSDGDGIPDGYEEVCSHVVLDPENPRGLLSPYTRDSDGDGLNDGEELKLGTSPGLKDTDGDGIPDGWEVSGKFSIYDDGTYAIEITPIDPTKQDTDGDGLSDWVEAMIAFHILAWNYGSMYADEVKDLVRAMPKVADSDGDGLNDGEETFTFCSGEDPFKSPLFGSLITREFMEKLGMKTKHIFINWSPSGTGCALYITAFFRDSDGDGLNDGEELKLGTAILGPDTDGDYLPDGREVELSTDPKNPDTDGDGLIDGEEVYTFDELGHAKPMIWITSNRAYEPSKFWTTDPTNPDTDGDGLTDGEEILGRQVAVYYNTLKYWHHYSFETHPFIAVFSVDATSDPTNPDTDGDGLTDGEDPFVWSFRDSDDDGLSDTRDPCPWIYDCDFDGLNDSAELSYGTDPKRPDTDCDYLPDGYEITVNYRDQASGKILYLDPKNPDTDGDGLIDGREIFCNCVDNDYCPNPFLPGKKRDCGVKKLEVTFKGIGRVLLYCTEAPKKLEERPRDSYEVNLESETKGVKITKSIIMGKVPGQFTLSFSNSFYTIWIGDKKFSCSLDDAEAKINPSYGVADVAVDASSRKIYVNFTGDALIGTLTLRLEYSCNTSFGPSLKDVEESYSVIVHRAAKPEVEIISKGWDEELNVGRVTLLCRNCRRVEIVAAGATINGKKKRVIEYAREEGLREIKFRVVPIARFYSGFGDVGDIYGSFENRVEVLKTGKEIGVLLAKASLAKSTISKIAYGIVAAAKGVKVIAGGIETFVPEEEEETEEAAELLESKQSKTATLASKIKDMLVDKGVELLEESIVRAADKYEEKISRVKRSFRVVVKACNDEGCTVESFNLEGYAYE